MIRNIPLRRRFDWLLIVCYLLLVIIGWVNIFAVAYDPELTKIVDTAQRHGMQMIWIMVSLCTAILILCIDAKAYQVLAGTFYAAGILLLIAVLVAGVERHGSRSWILLGPISLQPAEFVKITVSLALAKVMSKYGFKLNNWRAYLTVGLLLLVPVGLILLEKETGLALVFVALLIPLYREGMPGAILLFGFFAIMLFLLSMVWKTQWVFFLVLCLCLAAYLLLGNKKGWALGLSALFFLVYFLLPHFSPYIDSLKKYRWFLLCAAPLLVTATVYAFRKREVLLKLLVAVCIAASSFVLSVDYLFNSVLQPHQRARIENLIGIKQDLYGVGYNVHQSKVAIGSGGFIGKGFLQGTQTKFNFVPEQSTDFIFCTIGEEWGFLGSVLVILLYLFFIIRIVIVAERQKENFVRIYGYCVASCFFFHFFVNIGMTIGLMPVIGIPLPFISYGGSSLLSFTMLLFILIKMDTKYK